MPVESVIMYLRSGQLSIMREFIFIQLKAISSALPILLIISSSFLGKSGYTVTSPSFFNSSIYSAERISTYSGMTIFIMIIITGKQGNYINNSFQLLIFLNNI